MNSDFFNYHRKQLDESGNFKIIMSEFITNSPSQFEILEALKSDEVILNNYSGNKGSFFLYEDEFIFEFNYFNQDLSQITEEFNDSKKLVLSIMHVSEF